MSIAGLVSPTRGLRALSVIAAMTAGVVAIACAGAPLSKEKLTLPPKERLHLYLLLGQSNMVGRDAPADEDRQTHPRVLTINRAGVWEPACDPLPHTDAFSKGVGPGMTFARTLVEQDESVTIGLVPCAKGGSALSQWGKGTELYDAAVARARLAQQDGVLRGILWHQGESEISNARLANTYADRVTDLFVELRRDLATPDLPIIVGEIGHYLYAPDRFPYARTVNAALAQVPQRLEHAGLVTAEGLDHRGDGVHMNTESQRKLGKRFARELLRLRREQAEQDAANASDAP